ncbi:MAG TPA: adenylate/guanylate cyclase domain-containing protein [Ilumatobacter sp.]
MTFLFTDVEGSTRLWAADRAAMSASLQVHDAVLRAAIESHGGYVFATAGDSFAAAFSRASDAVAASEVAQSALADASWPGPVLRVRMGLHLGEAEERGGDYFGPVVNTAARVEAAGHGGQVLISDAVRAAASLAADTVSDLGQHRLRDVAEPVHLYQLGHHEFAALRVVDPALSNLPTRPTRLIGRDQEIARVRELLTGSRLVTITAVGGSGKTRLAIAIGEAELVHRRDGVWFVDLSDAMTDADVTGAVANGLGMSIEAGDATTQVARYLADKDALVILDNCEHVIEGCAEFAERFLAAAGESVLLATSREALDVDGERVVTLRSLPCDDTDSPGVRLFVDRATAVDPDFELSESNAAAVAGVCRRLDGMPLAIELAAARVTVMTADELLAGLDDRFGLLSGGRRRSRQRTLEATLDWSYDLLEPDQQRVFRSLGVFVGGFDLEAFSAVAALRRSAAIDMVEALVAKSLVVRTDRAAGSRFGLLETVKAYAEDRLVDAGEAVEVRDRHLAHFHQRATGRGRTASGSMAHGERLVADLGNISVAFGWAADTGRWPIAAEVATCSLMGFWWERRMVDAVDLVLRTQANGEAFDPDLHGCVTALAADVCVMVKDWDGFRRNALELTTSPIAGFRALGHAKLAWMSVYFAADQVLDLLGQADAELARVESGGRSDVNAVATYWLGMARASMLLIGRRFADCEEFGLGWLADHGEVDDWMVSNAVRVTAMAQILLGRPGDALPTLELIGANPVFGSGIDVRAIAHLELGEFDSAREPIRGYAVEAATGRVRSVPGDALLLLAALAHCEHDDDRARLLLLDMGQSRHDATAAYGVYLARQLGIFTEYMHAVTEGAAPDPDYGMLGERRALFALRAELSRRGWA